MEDRVLDVHVRLRKSIVELFEIFAEELGLARLTDLLTEFVADVKREVGKEGWVLDENQEWRLLSEMKGGEKMELRQEVLKHARSMEARLKEHEDKGGWDESTFRFLIEDLKMHVEDLEYALFEQGRGEYSVERECADISNFAMMIADNFDRVPLEE